MAEPTDVPAWIALFLGIYSLAAAIGELRRPGGWTAMLAHFEEQPGLCISLGGAIYLVNPWRPDDWLAVTITVLGGLMVVEGAVIMAFGEPFLGFFRRMIGGASRGWTVFSALFGVAAIFAGFTRF
jgi:hypothetical protein